MDFLFTFLIVLVAAKKFQILMKFNISIFSFVAGALGVISKKLLPNPAVPDLFGTRDWFRERQFFHRVGLVWGMVQAIILAMGSNR